MIFIEKYNDFKYGVVNAIDPSELPKEALYKSQNMQYKENRWRKIPGLTEVNPTQISSTNGVWGIGFHYDIITKKRITLIYCGTDVFKLNDDLSTTSIDSVMSLNSQLEFMSLPQFTYFGSQNDKWRRYDGGTQTYFIGANNGDASDAPRKYIKILFNPFAGRYFAIGDPANPDYLNWSAHIDDEGIEKWPGANVQITESVNGDVPLNFDMDNGRILLVSKHSINSGTVVGVPQNWNFQKEKSQTGTIAGRTLKRYGSFYLMLTPDFEVYKWPNDVFVTKGRVKFNINPYKAHLACAEITENRYYDLCFESGEAVSSNKYHWWRYDILGDRWYGPSIQRNIVTMTKDPDKNFTLCGGVDDLSGYLMELRGLNIKNSQMKCHMITGYNFQGDINLDKRYTKVRVKAKQAGSLASSQGQLEVTANVDSWADAPQSQTLTLEDPANENPMDTSAVRDAIIKRAHIHELYGRGSSIQLEFKHEQLNGELEISEWEIEGYMRTKKEARSA